MSDGKEFSVYFEFYDLEKFPKTDWMILYQDPDKYRTRIELAQPRKIQQSQSTINSGFSVQYCVSWAFAVPTPKTGIMSTAQKATTVNFPFFVVREVVCLERRRKAMVFKTAMIPTISMKKPKASMKYSNPAGRVP